LAGGPGLPPFQSLTKEARGAPLFRGSWHLGFQLPGKGGR
jgi:hypothetical protein